MFTLITKGHTYSHYMAFNSRHCTELDQAPGAARIQVQSHANSMPAGYLRIINHNNEN